MVKTGVESGAVIEGFDKMEDAATVNFGAVAMSKEAALNLFTRLEEILGNSKTFADMKGLSNYYKRDIQFLEKAKSCLRLGDYESIQWVFEQMRNLSQGFGSYSPYQGEIDGMLDRLFVELQDALTRKRADVTKERRGQS